MDLIIFEGMYTIAQIPYMDLRSYVNLGIYLETTTENICKWKWERECKKFKPRNQNEFDNHMTLIFEDFVKFVYPSKRNADWIVFADDLHQLSIISNDR